MDVRPADGRTAAEDDFDIFPLEFFEFVKVKRFGDALDQSIVIPGIITQFQFGIHFALSFYLQRTNSQIR